MCRPVVVVIGKTEAGKDTLARMMKFQDDSYRILKCSEEMKRRVSFEHGIERDLLEHRAVKDSQAGLSPGKTYLDVMVDAFHEYGHKPKHFLLSQIQETLIYGLIPVITDIRHPNEIALLQDAGCYIILIRVLSQRAVAKSSDEHIRSIWYKGVGCGYPHMTVWNNDGLESLLWHSELAHRYIQNMMRNCHETANNSK